MSVCRASAAAVLLLAGACHDSGPPSAVPADIPLAPKSGGRLRAQYLVAEDGTRAFAGWFDGDRMERCHFVVAEDGELRCLPAKDGLVMRGCGDAVVSYDQGEPCDPRYAGDPNTRAIYRIDPASAMPGMVTVGKCLLGGPAQVTYRVDRVAPSEFVRAQRARRSSDPGDRLTPLDLVADDGSVEPRGWYDLMLSSECAPAIAADGVRRCLPVADSCLRADFYSDETCREVYSNPAETCSPTNAPRFARGAHPLSSRPFACPDDRIDLFRPAGSQREAGGSLFLTDATGACAPASAPWGRRQVLTPLDPGQFAVLPTPGGHRLRDPQAGLQCPEGCGLDAAYHDGTLAVPCRFAATEGGPMRCLPPARVTVYYADPACTHAVVGGKGVVAQTCLGAAGREIAPVQVAVAPSSCAPVTRAVALGPPLAPGTVYEKTEMGCQESHPGVPLFEMGPPVELTRFASGSVETE